MRRRPLEGCEILSERKIASENNLANWFLRVKFLARVALKVRRLGKVTSGWPALINDHRKGALVNLGRGSGNCQIESWEAATREKKARPTLRE